MHRARPTADRYRVLVAVARGESVASTGVPTATVRSWRRRDPDFAEAYEAANATAVKIAEEPLTPDEWEHLLATACRRGSTSALRLWRETHPTSAVMPTGPVDELGALRTLREQLSAGR